MLKKLLKAGVVVVAVVGVDQFVFGGAGWDYATGWVHDTRDWMADREPPESKLKKARKMIRNLDPVIKQNRHRVAEEEVQLEKLSERIERMTTKLANDKSEIMVLKKGLDGKQQFVSIAGRPYSEEEVKLDLTRRFKRYKTNQETLTSYRNLHLVHAPQLYCGKRLHTPLDDLGVSENTGKFAHPGEMVQLERTRRKIATQQRQAEERLQQVQDFLKGASFSNNPNPQMETPAAPPSFERRGTCRVCGVVTSDWVTYFGQTQECICRACKE